MARQIKVDDTTGFLNGPQAEKFAGVSKGYFVYLRGAGRGPVYLRRGHRIFYRKDDIHAWLRDQKLFTEVLAVKK